MKKHPPQKLSPIVQLLLVIVLFFAQHFAFLHTIEHEQTLTPDESCIICLLSQDNKLALPPENLALLCVSILIAYILYAYHASPFLTLHNRLAQTRAPPAL